MGFQDLLPLLLGGSSALFSGGTNATLSQDQQWAIKRLKDFLHSEHQYARSAPLSSTLEQQGLANESALLSQAQRRSAEGLFGGQSAVDLGNPSQNDALKNLSQANTAQQGTLYSNAYQTGLADRRNAKRSLPGYVQSIAGIASNPVNPPTNSGMESLLPLLYQFGQQWGQRGKTGGGNPNDPTAGMGNGGTPGVGTGFEPAQTTGTQLGGFNQNAMPYWSDPSTYWGQ